MSNEIYIVTLDDIFKNIETEEKTFKFKDYIKKMQEENEQLHSIIKEVREYFDDLEIFAPSRDIKYDILEILDKVGDIK